MSNTAAASGPALLRDVSTIRMAIRIVQTPTSSGYGFGASVITAGLMLTPFSATAFLASRTIPPLVRRSRGNLLLPAAGGLVLLCLVAFAFLRGSLWEVFVVMTVAGYGVGALYAATPGFIGRSAPQGTTTSAMSFNLVLTTIGGAIGSALSALVLQAATAHGASIPTGHGYVVAAFVGAGALAVAVLLSYLLRPLFVPFKLGDSLLCEPARLIWVVHFIHESLVKRN